MRERIAWPWLLLALIPWLLGAAQQPAPAVPDPLPLAWCLEHAQEQNPDLAAVEAESQAAEHRIKPAGSLEDPRLGWDLVNIPKDSLDLDSTPMSGVQLRLAQKFPFPGLLANRERAARAAAGAAREGFNDRSRRVAAAVERVWTELGFAQRALAITDRNIDLLRQLTRIAETKFSVGSGLQQDVLRAQVELTALLQERLRREAAIRKAGAALAGLLDLPPESRLTPTDEIAEEAPLPDLEPLLTRLEETSPLLRAMEARIEEAERLRRVTVLAGYPDFDLGLGYRLRRQARGDPVEGDDFLFAGLTVRMPLDRAKWRERVAERNALLRRAKAAYRAARARLRDGLRASFADLERADSEVTLLETGLVPQARQSLESNRSGYEVDKVDFLSLIDSQVSLLDAELRLVRAVADRRVGFAAIEAELGEELR